MNLYMKLFHILAEVYSAQIASSKKWPLSYR
jgi:hypothetical protein